MRHDRLYLTDMVEAADDVSRFLEALDDEAFYEDDLRQSAVLQKLIVIGEAASRVSPAVRDQFPEVEWPDIVAFRNIAVHAYFSVNWEIVWVTATQDVPRLRQHIAEILVNLQQE